MSETGEAKPTALAELRAKIDAIDEEMHRLLMERGEVIDALIRTKGTSLPGAAFRPGREANMMRRMVARHRSGLPLVTAEHIWREIITTFTNLQAPFTLALDGAAPREAMHDAARFYFGFAVPIAIEPDATAIVARVARNGADLGLVAMQQKPGAGPWWRGLGGRGPQIMALLPFIRAAGRPADMPAFVVSPPLSDPTPGDIALFAATVESGSPSAGSSLAILAETAGNGRREALLAAPVSQTSASLPAFAAGAGVSLREARDVGAVARGIAIGGVADLLYGASAPGR